jgi:hypothetical protein
MILTAMAFITASPVDLHAQSRQQIKVLVEFRQSGDRSEQDVRGSGQIIIRERRVHPSGSLAAQETQTRVQQSTGIFTLVQDGGESALNVATRVPYIEEVAYYRNYAIGAGYISSAVIFQDVGTSLKVRASILPDNQVRVYLIPRISYFSSGRSGAIEFTEAATELVVPSGQPMVIGGTATQMHEIARQILGFGGRQTGNETTLVLTATIQ